MMNNFKKLHARSWKKTHYSTCLGDHGGLHNVAQLMSAHISISFEVQQLLA